MERFHDDLRITVGTGRAKSGTYPQGPLYPLEHREPPPPLPGGDLFRNNLIFHLVPNGIAGSESYADVSPVGATIQKTGTVPLSATPTLFTDPVMNLLAGVGHLYVSYHSRYQFQASTFSVEAWVYCTASGTEQFLLSQWQHPQGGWFFRIRTTGHLEFVPYYNMVSVLSDTLFPLNQWVHICCIQVQRKFRLFMDGVIVGEAVYENVVLPSISGVPFIIGGYTNDWYAFQGYLGEVRIYSGAIPYLDAFTPPTGPFPRS